MADDDLTRTTNLHSSPPSSQTLWPQLPPAFGSLSFHNDITSPFSPQCFSSASLFDGHPYTPQISLHPWACHYQSLNNLYGPYPFGVPAAFHQPPSSSYPSSNDAVKKESILGPSSVLTAEDLDFYRSQAPVKKRSCETNKRPGRPYKPGSKERTEEQKAMARQRARVYRAKKKRETLEKLTSVRMSNFGQSQYHTPQISSNSQWPYPPPGFAHHHPMYHSSSAYFPPSSIPTFQPVHNPYPPEYQNPIYPYRSVPSPQSDMKLSAQHPAYHHPPQRMHSWPEALHHTPTPAQYHPPPNTPVNNQHGTGPGPIHQQSHPIQHMGHATDAHNPNQAVPATTTSAQYPPGSHPNFTSSTAHPSAFHRVNSSSFIGPYSVTPSESYLESSLASHAITTSKVDKELKRRGPPSRPGAKERTEEQKARARESSRAYRERKMLGITINRKELDAQLGKRQRYAMLSAKVAIKRDMEKEEEEYRPSHRGKTGNGPRRRSTRTVVAGGRPEYRDKGGSAHL